MSKFAVAGSWKNNTMINAANYEQATKIAINLLQRRYITCNEKSVVNIYQNGAQISSIRFEDYFKCSK